MIAIAYVCNLVQILSEAQERISPYGRYITVGTAIGCCLLCLYLVPCTLVVNIVGKLAFVNISIYICIPM